MKELNMQIIQNAKSRVEFGQGGFHISRIFPGLSLKGSNDRGFGPLGAFDYATLEPGVTVPMHEHRNDEIISYMRKGTMHHKDTSGLRLPISPTQFVAMSAGSSIYHEESVPTNGESVEILQIFVRPHTINLPPNVQQHSFEQSVSTNQWRNFVGPEKSDAPLKVRNDVCIYDTHLEKASLLLPEQSEYDGLLYVFHGKVLVSDEELTEGDSMLFIEERGVQVQTDTSADLVYFQINKAAPITRAGTLSG